MKTRLLLRSGMYVAQYKYWYSYKWKDTTGYNHFTKQDCANELIRWLCTKEILPTECEKNLVSSDLFKSGKCFSFEIGIRT